MITNAQTKADFGYILSSVPSLSATYAGSTFSVVRTNLSAEDRIELSGIDEAYDFSVYSTDTVGATCEPGERIVVDSTEYLILSTMVDPAGGVVRLDLGHRLA